jgi:hypothetical protein
VLAVQGAALSRGEVAERSGYSITSSGFSNSLSALRTRRLIEGSSHLHLTEDFAAATKE